MSFDSLALGEKLKKYREQFNISFDELSNATGISVESLKEFENGGKLPTGDEILIFADFYKCDYKIFISNEKIATFKQTETLFRRYKREFSKTDRWAVQEILYLADCEEFLIEALGFTKKEEFSFKKVGDYFKGHGIEAAKELRKFLNYPDNEVPMDIYQDFRNAGIHVFRRWLKNSRISGLFINHPIAGKCILINYSEDIYRQRFTAAHEAGHAIFDMDKDVIVSFTKWDRKDLVEIRADTFASHYLMPPEFLKKIPDSKMWNKEKAIKWANKFKVSTEAFSYALREQNLIDDQKVKEIKSVKVPRELKIDPELSNTLSPRSKERKTELLKLGLSSYYVNLCFEAYRRDVISSSRMAEMLLTDKKHLTEIVKLYGEELRYGS